MDEIKSIIGLDEAERLSLLRWSGRLPEATHVERIRLSRTAYFKLKAENPKIEKDTLEYCALVLSLHNMRHVREIQHRKSRHDKDALKRLDDIQIQRTLALKKKTRGRGQHYDFIKMNFEEISRLRSAKMSWRDIKNHIGLHHRKKISHTQVYRAFREIADEREKQNRFFGFGEEIIPVE